MNAVRTRIAVVTVALVTSAFALHAIAQTAASRGMIVGPGNRCLTIEGTYGASSAPPAATRVSLAPCDGRPSQRWFAVFGDWNYTQGLGESCLGYREQPASGAPGRIEMTVTPCNGSRHSDLTITVHQIATTWHDPRRCVAARGVGAQTVFTLEPCSDTADQHWEIR